MTFAFVNNLAYDFAQDRRGVLWRFRGARHRSLLGTPRNVCDLSYSWQQSRFTAFRRTTRSSLNLTSIPSPAGSEAADDGSVPGRAGEEPHSVRSRPSGTPKVAGRTARRNGMRAQWTAQARLATDPKRSSVWHLSPRARLLACDDVPRQLSTIRKVA